MDSSKSHPDQWKQHRIPIATSSIAYDAKIKMTRTPRACRAEMDSLNAQYVKLSKTSIIEQYAFIPAHPTAISYLTANFLHGGWLHIIGNMWFLWLAGFVLEDVWGRWLYSGFLSDRGRGCTAVLCVDESWQHHANAGRIGRGGGV